MQTVKGEEKFICFLHMHVDQKTDQQVPFSRYILKKKVQGDCSLLAYGLTLCCLI